MFSRAIRVNVTHAASIDRLARELVETGAQNVLDLCCGSGALIRRLRELGWEGEYTGVDASRQMLRYAERDPNARYACEDVRELKYHRDSFDVVVSHNGLYNWNQSDVVRLLERAASWSRDKVFVANPTYIDPEAVAKGNSVGSSGSSILALRHAWQTLNVRDFFLSFITLIFFKVFIDKGEKMLDANAWATIIDEAEVEVLSTREHYAGTGICVVFTKKVEHC